MRQLFFLITVLCYSFATSVFAEDATTTFTLTTNAFLDKGPIPVRYTCDGEDKSPQLSWSNLPAKTEALVLLFDDPDAPNGNFYHWILFNIPKTTKELAEGIQQLPAGTQVGKNSFGKLGYNGPCPPKSKLHTYKFTLYALDKKLSLKKESEGNEVSAAIKDHTLGKAELNTVYSRWVR